MLRAMLLPVLFAVTFVACQGTASSHDLVGLLIEDQEGADEDIIRQLSSWEWEAGATIVICFFDGSELARSQFMALANDAITGTSLHLRLAPDCPLPSADVHVSFAGGGHKSHVGTRARTVDMDKPTLFLEGMGHDNPWTNNEIRTARHEIGHMLGLLHEHQHPDIDCGFLSFEEASALELVPGGWTSSHWVSFLENIAYADNLAPYDHYSIMHYDLPPAFFEDGVDSPCYRDEAVFDYSPDDRAFLRVLYTPRLFDWSDAWVILL